MQHRVHCAPTCEQREEGLAEEIVEATVKALILAVLEVPRCGEGARASGDEDCKHDPENRNVEKASHLPTPQLEHCCVWNKILFERFEDE